jgi:hypothetical protein
MAHNAGNGLNIILLSKCGDTPLPGAIGRLTGDGRFSDSPKSVRTAFPCHVPQHVKEYAERRVALKVRDMMELQQRALLSIFTTFPLRHRQRILPSAARRTIPALQRYE